MAEEEVLFSPNLWILHSKQQRQEDDPREGKATRKDRQLGQEIIKE